MHMIVDRCFISATFQPKPTVKRVLYGTFVIFTLVISQSYKGNLVALLASPKVNLPFDSLEELVNQNDVIYKLPTESDVAAALKVKHVISLM